jgi:hypothetical protein
MRKEYNKAVYFEFENLLKASLPQFKRAKSQDNMGPETRLYSFQAAEQLHYFIKLIPHRLQQQFTLEVGWSVNGELPKLIPFATPYESAATDGVVVRLARFYVDSDPWWIVEPPLSGSESLRRMREGIFPDPQEHLPCVPDLVADAVGKIKDYVIPYFTRIAAEHGVGVKFG